MNGHGRSPLNKANKQASFDPGLPGRQRSNPFDSDDETENRQSLFSSKRTSDPPLATHNVSSNPFDDDNNSGSSASSYSLSSGRSRYKNDFRDAGGLENQTVQELENYSVYKAEETTETVNNCLKIAEDMREGATKTLVTLHQQGDQISRTHAVAADIDHDLSRVSLVKLNYYPCYEFSFKHMIAVLMPINNALCNQSLLKNSEAIRFFFLFRSLKSCISYEH